MLRWVRGDAVWDWGSWCVLRGWKSWVGWLRWGRREFRLCWEACGGWIARVYIVFHDSIRCCRRLDRWLGRSALAIA